MTEDEKSGVKDKPNQLSESFTLEPLRLIQTRDFDHSVQVIRQQNQIERAIRFQISTSLVMILKSMYSDG